MAHNSLLVFELLRPEHLAHETRFRCLMTNHSRLLRAEVHIHSGSDFDRLAINRVWLVAPIADSIDSCATQGPGAVDRAQRFDRSACGDRCLQCHGSLDMLRSGRNGVLWPGSGEEVALHDAGLDV